MKYIGTEYHKQNGLKGAFVTSEKFKLLRIEKEKEYWKNPKLCLSCNKEINYKGYKNKLFCNKSCAAKYNGSRKPLRTETSKRKTSESLKASERVKEDRRRKRIKYEESTKHKCLCCENILNGRRKTCSTICKKAHLSRLMSERLAKVENRINYGRGKQSYLEKSFEEWLFKNNITCYETEKRFYNKELNKNYFVDFIFENKKLIIELDETQHSKTMESDKVRDKYLESCGYKVVRVTYKEYKSKSKEALIKKLILM